LKGVGMEKNLGRGLNGVPAINICRLSNVRSFPIAGPGPLGSLEGTREDRSDRECLRSSTRQCQGIPLCPVAHKALISGLTE